MRARDIRLQKRRMHTHSHSRTHTLQLHVMRTVNAMGERARARSHAFSDAGEMRVLEHTITMFNVRTRADRARSRSARFDCH